MSKYLVLKFENAKVFAKFDKDGKNYKTKDFVADFFGYKSRNYYPAFIEPITAYQISNVLHVIFNERPVPSLRKVFYPKINYYFDKAKKSYLKITTPKINYGNFYYEQTSTKKAVFNSWNKTPQINWEIIRKFIDNEFKYDKFIKYLTSLLDVDVKTISVNETLDLMKKLDDDKKIEFNKVISSDFDKLSGLYYYFGRYNKNKIEEPNLSALTTKLNKTARTVNNGVDTCVFLSGEILVPVNEEDIFRLKNYSKGFATILDDGLVFIDSIQYENNISDEGFILVEDISTKKAPPLLT